MTEVALFGTNKTDLSDRAPGVRDYPIVLYRYAIRHVLHT